MGAESLKIKVRKDANFKSLSLQEMESSVHHNENKYKMMGRDGSQMTISIALSLHVLLIYRPSNALVECLSAIV